MMRTPVAPLFVPGHMKRLRDKAVELDIEGLRIDLEDAVPLAEKEAARLGAIELVRARPGRAAVRINPLAVTVGYGTGCGLEDLAAVVIPGLRGIIAPKTESPDDVLRVDAAIAERERVAGLPENALELGVIIETALGIANLLAIARTGTARPMRLSFGMGDFTTDLGLEWTRDEDETAVPRALVPIMSRAAGLPRPSDSVFTDVADEDGLRASALRGKRLGYAGKSAIHPRQIAVIEAVYRPTPAEAAWGRRVVEAAVARTAAGEGAFLLDGRMIDDPIIVRAREVVEQADRFGGDHG